MRQLSPPEEQKLKILTANSISLTLIEPTETGLKKSIMDATGSVRNYLKDKCFHDFEMQGQGPSEKIFIESRIYTQTSVKNSQASLYRPVTKKGDPRIWFYGLGQFADPNDILALICFEEKIHVLNITQLPIEKIINSRILTPLKELIEEIRSRENFIANELLYLLKEIAKRGPIPSEVEADTGVGRTLETLLGIDINSSPQPDYKGIELKTFRGNKGNRKNLFAQVPNWKISDFKSSAEILDAFGYWREEDFKLYCTVSSITTNSQGLALKIDSGLSHLVEFSSNKEIGDFVKWEIKNLHEKLLQKHRETFWVEAKSIKNDGKEFFQYQAVEHTRKPIVSQFDLLLEQGFITLDHLIKRNSKGKVVEKGPLFKIKPKALNLLFPPSKSYDLLSNFN